MSVNMKSAIILFLCAVIFTTVVNGATESTNLEEYERVNKECLTTTNTDSKVIIDILTRAKEAGPAAGPYLLCLHKKYNIQNDNGDIDLPAFRASLELFYTKDRVTSVMDNCSIKREEGTSAEKAAIDLMKCFLKYINVPAPKNTN